MENAPNKDDFHIKTKHINTLFQFLKNNKYEQFLEYIDSLTPEEVDVNLKDENGNYLIFLAIMMNNRRILRKLIEYGSRMDLIDTEGFGIMYYPIKFNYLEIIDLLLEYDKKIIGVSLVNLKDARGNVPLFYAIKYKNNYALQELLINGADANYKNSEYMNALHLAILKRDTTMARMLSKYISNIDSRTNRGSTPLHYACNFGLFDIVQILLDKGADPNLMEFEYDFTPLFYAVVQNNIPITKILIDYGSNTNNQDYIGNTVIHYAIAYNHLEILDYIFDHIKMKTLGTNIYVEDINKHTDNKDNYIDPNIVNIDGITITHLMLYNFKDDYEKYIIKILPYANLNYQDNIGNTALHIIAENNLWNKFAEQLQHKKLNIFIKNNQGKTVMDMIPLIERENILTIVAQSYYNYLKKYDNGWRIEWQNKCSKENLNEHDESLCIKEIRKAIINNKISIPEKKDKKSITVTEEEVVNFSTFTGSLLDMICGFKYLTKKYNNVTSLFHANQENNPELNMYNRSLGILENTKQHIIQFEIRWIYQKLFLPPDFDSIVSSIINNTKYRYIIIPIGIILSNGNHSNGLFYDIANHVMERFEPHGSGYPSQFNYNPDLLDEILYKKMSSIMSNIYSKNITIKYYQPKKYLPKIGLQTFENTEINVNKNIGDPNGFCTLWTIWYFDYRLKYVDINPRYLVKHLIREIKINNYSFRTIIRNYSRNITDLRDYYLSKINKNVNDYNNNRLTNDEIKKLLIEILTD